jgi:hypothetical protein
MAVPELQTLSDEETRKAAFAAVVALQDEGIPAGHCRVVVAQRFGLGVREVRQVEREGLAKKWPPL